MKAYAFNHKVSRRALAMNARLLLVNGNKQLVRGSLAVAGGAWQLVLLVGHAMFAPAPLYKQESLNEYREVNPREEYQKFQIPRGPFC